MTHFFCVLVHPIPNSPLCLQGGVAASRGKVFEVALQGNLAQGNLFNFSLQQVVEMYLFAVFS